MLYKRSERKRWHDVVITPDLSRNYNTQKGNVNSNFAINNNKKMEVKDKSFPKDMSVVFVRSKTFPAGIKEAFDILKSKVGHIKRVSYFGISNPEGGNGIVYRAAAATMPEVDAEKLGLGVLDIKGGNYYSIKLTDISKNINLISQAFEHILSKPNIDPNGHCIEIYDYFGSDSVECIVRKADQS